MNSTELSVRTLGDAVRERVKSAIFDSIPDAAIESLIANEFKAMTNATESAHIGGNYVKLSPLQLVIAAEIRKQMSERSIEAVRKHLDEALIVKPGELVSAAVKELAPLFMASMCERFAAIAVQDLRNQLSSKGIYL